MGGWFYDLTAEIFGTVVAIIVIALWVIWRLRLFVLLTAGLSIIGWTAGFCW
jgi:hypothetical protein